MYHFPIKLKRAEIHTVFLFFLILACPMHFKVNLPTTPFYTLMTILVDCSANEPPFLHCSTVTVVQQFFLFLFFISYDHSCAFRLSWRMLTAIHDTNTETLHSITLYNYKNDVTLIMHSNGSIQYKKVLQLNLAIGHTMDINIWWLLVCW